MKRRKFLRQAGLFSTASLLTVGTHGWAIKGLAAGNNSPRLIVIFLRGAIDGLSVVVPYQEAV